MRLFWYFIFTFVLAACYKPITEIRYIDSSPPLPYHLRDSCILTSGLISFSRLDTISVSVNTTGATLAVVIDDCNEGDEIKNSNDFTNSNIVENLLLDSCLLNLNIYDVIDAFMKETNYYVNYEVLEFSHRAYLFIDFRILRCNNLGVYKVPAGQYRCPIRDNKLVEIQSIYAVTGN